MFSRFTTLILLVLCSASAVTRPPAFADPPSGMFIDVKTVNTFGGGNFGPNISSDSLEFFFYSNRFGAQDADLYLLSRSSIHEPFQNLTHLESLSSPEGDKQPSIASDGKTLFFASERSGGEGNRDIYQATRSVIGEPFGNVVNLGPEINTSGTDGHPDVSEDGLSLYYMTDGDLYEAKRSSTMEPFANATNLGPIVNSPQPDAGPSRSSDGSTLFMHSGRPGRQTNFRDIFVTSREDGEFTLPVNLDKFSLGSDVNSRFAGQCCIFEPEISADWPNTGSKLYFNTGGSIYEATWLCEESGDFNCSGELDTDDIDLLTARVRSGANYTVFDLDDDQQVDDADRSVWINDVAQTWSGDSNLDGEFNSGDLVAVFKAGEYEDGVVGNSGWAEGDWNGDGEFETGDLVQAFKGGGFEQGQRPTTLLVPEPSYAYSLLAVAIFVMQRRRMFSSAGRLKNDVRHFPCLWLGLRSNSCPHGRLERRRRV